MNAPPRGGFFWKIVAANGETLTHNEVYTTKASAQHAISVVKANAASAPRTLELLDLEEAAVVEALPRTPNGLAALLGVTGLNVRNFLRGKFPRSAGEQGTRWRLDDEQVQAVLEESGPMPSRSGELAARYSGFVAVLDEMIERLEERGTELRDRLDAQSVAWWLADGDPPAEWSEDDQTAFRQWRGETAPPGPTPPQGAVFPAVPQDVADGLYLPQWWLQEIADLLNQRRQVVFYGPPGTGKTYIAQRLGELVESVGGRSSLFSSIRRTATRTSSRGSGPGRARPAAASPMRCGRVRCVLPRNGRPRSRPSRICSSLMS